MGADRKLEGTCVVNGYSTVPFSSAICRDIVWCRWLIDYANKDATLFFLFCALCIGLWNYYVCRLVASRGLQVYKIHGKINWQQG